MSVFRVSKQQKDFFDTFGYLVFRGLMKDRITEITQEFEKVFAECGGNYDGKAHDYMKSSVIVAFLGHSERLASLLDDERVCRICDALLGEDWNYLTSAGNRYVGSTGWHSDTIMDTVWPENVKSINLSYVLDPVTRDTGALRVIPGSHMVKDQFTERLKQKFGESDPCSLWGVDSSGVPSVALETKPGDLLVFNNYLKHATFGGGSNRRVLLTNFSRHYPDEYLDELHAYISTFAKYWVEELHGPAVLEHGGVQRRKHLQQIQQHQGHLPALARAEKEKAMAEQ